MCSFARKNPAALAKWHNDHLGVSPAPTDMETPPWTGEGGVTVFAPFAADTDYFPAQQQVMINFRVVDLDAMMGQLRDAGIDIFNVSTMDGIGRFAHLKDPEGNAIELWEPAG